MNGSESATKQDIKQLRPETSHEYNKLLAAIRDREAKLLQAFSGYAALNHKRITQQDANIAVFLEKPFNMQPGA